MSTLKHTHIIIQDTKRSLDRDIRIQINNIRYTRKDYKVNEIIMFIHCFSMVMCINTKLLHNNNLSVLSRYSHYVHVYDSSVIQPTYTC